MTRIVLGALAVALIMGSGPSVRAQAGVDAEFKKLVDAFVRGHDKPCSQVDLPA
jgi:hypothetical protein